MIPVASFDLETTGVDVETDRIVTGALVILDAEGRITASRTWLLNPGIPIPAAATAIHGVTDAHAAAGMDPGEALRDIRECLAYPLGLGSPLVVFNAPYDLTLFDREYRRHVGEHELTFDRVLDPLVLDKGIDRYRKGKRTLTVTAEHYGVQFDGGAHGARADATAAGRLAQLLMTTDALAQYGPAGIMAAQQGWAREQADGLRAYFERSGNLTAAATVDGAWPMRARS